MNVDKRFSRIAKDARFKRIPRKEKKVKIDSRFKSMFTDKKFKTKYFVDKRGRPVMKSSKEDLKRFYEMEEDDVNQKPEDAGDSEETSKVNNQVDPLSSEKMQEGKEVDIQKGAEQNDTESDDNDDDDDDIDFSDIRGGGMSSSSDDDDDDVEDGNEEQLIEHSWGELDQDAPRKEDAVTSRLAACNLDWDRVSADDLFVLFSSLGGSIKSVKIFLSEFGKQRLAEEDLNGPSELKKDHDSNHYDDNDGDESSGDDDPNNLEGSKFHLEKLRKYQLNRMKYYYAVVDCNSEETASNLYDQYDGMEFELSATRLDLRFIPEDMEFEDEPKSIVTQAPLLENFRPTTFCNTALQQSTVRSTWDEPDQKRLSVTMRKFNKDELLNMDFKAYLASSSDEDDNEAVGKAAVAKPEAVEKDGNDNEDQSVEKYRALLQEIEAKEHKDDNDQHMEISWAPGLSETAEKIVKNKIEKEEEKSLTPWEKYKKDRKKKRKERKQAGESEMEANDDNEENVGESDNEEGDSAGFNDPFFTQDLSQEENIENGARSKKKRKVPKKGEKLGGEDDTQKQNELELLLMDDKDDKQHFNLKSIMANEKKKKKNKKDKYGKSGETIVDNFEIDVQDSRFDALFTSHEYAPDPSDPQFKKTKAMEKILEEKQRRRKENSSKKNSDVGGKKNEDEPRPFDPSLSALIKTVKSRTEQFQKRKKSKLS